ESLKILERLVEDTENQELIFIRAVASHFLACHYCESKKIPHAHAHSKANVQLCSSATAEDKGRSLKFGGKVVSASDVFGGLKKASDNIRKGSGDILACCDQDLCLILQKLVALGSNPLDIHMSLSEMQPGTAQEWLDLAHKLSSKVADGSKLFKMPPTLNSKALAAVKSFPESDKTYLVFGKGTIHSVSQIFQDPGLPDEVAQDIDAKFQDKLVYRVFEVDMIRVKWGETHNVFRSVQVVLCSAEDSYEKNLLSTFVAACLEPEGKTYLDTPAPADGSRPKKVLFATSPCAKHPQIRTFMANDGL
ncbi:expressed unknown protein (Partial), partial [Seminavis robusta]